MVKTIIKNQLSTSLKIFETIEKDLVKHGAKSVSYTWGEGELASTKIALTFTIQAYGQELFFHIPVDIGAVQRILKSKATTYAQGRSYTIAKAAQIAWANVRDWVSSQMAMIDMGQGNLQRQFIGFLLEPAGKRTLYEIMENERFLLPEQKDIIIEN